MVKSITDIAKSLFNNKGGGDGEKLEHIEDIHDQPMDERKLVEYVRDKVDQVRQSNSRIAQEGIYLTNVAYLLGFDGVYYDTTYRQFKNVDSKRKLTRNRFKINKILPTCQNKLARLTQSPPRYDVRPNSNSTEDKDACRLALHIIENVFSKQRFNEKRQDLLMAAMQGGYSYAQVVWDPNLGKPMIDPLTGEMSGYEGDIRIEILNSLEVFADPLAKSIDDAQYLVKAKVRKLEYFKSRYPERGHLVKEEDAWLLSSIYDLKSNALTSVGITGASTQDQMKNSAIEIVYYEKRCKEYPNGRMICTANGVLLEDKELPVGEFDIVKFDDIMIGGRYNSEAVITHLRPIQDQYNVTRTKCAEWIRKTLGGKYIAAKGAGLSQEAINNDSGEVVEYNPVANAQPPTAMVIPMIPQYVYKDLETLDKEFDFVSGINEISRGVLPSASIPAAGMAFLQEQDQTRIGVQTNRNEINYAKVAQLVLKYVEKNYVLPRVLKIAGEGLEYAVKEFVGSDIKNNTDVICIEGSTIPSSKVLRRQDISNAFQMGLLGNPQDPKTQSKVLEMMEYGDTDEMWKDQALDEAQVKRVIKAIEEEDQLALNGMLDEFDNHAYHLTAMNEYRKQDKYEKLSDNQKAMFKYIMEWRLQALVGINNPQLAQQQQLATTMEQTMNQGIAQQNQQPQLDANGGMPAPQMEEQQVPNLNTLQGAQQ